MSLAEKLPIERKSRFPTSLPHRVKTAKRFYYHFEDKAHLIRWVFRNDLAETLLERFDSDHLVYEREGDGAIADKPYYAFKKVGVRSLMDLNSSKHSPTRSKSAVHITPRRSTAPKRWGYARISTSLCPGAGARYSIPF